ncbi:galactose mutarotase-like domain-containing protein [Pelagophyceae sp. CCMP2097]|nr:galactose mutarotase-like domain-containing protein [Pelagophyceae sp. CCMP2097]|mmetsp:Transcript_28407/g.95660  ORF Transcript_28407/g.95660 Transcript_28407/m.95660 type:complete len:307 (+) Transcript_28407:27-947(+)
MMRAALLVSGAAALLAPAQKRAPTQLGATRVMRGAEDAGLGFIELSHDSGASAKIFPFGADVCSFKDSSGTEWIATRPDAKLDGSKPISGGLSHCFPQFGPGVIQQHGFARNVEWKVAGWEEGKDAASATFMLKPSAYSKAMWDAPFEVHFTVTLNANSLETEMKVMNTGDADSFEFQAALHSYFHVSDIETASIKGSFKGKSYLDKMLTPPATVKETRASITIDSEYDRVYAGVNDPVLVDSGKKKQLAIQNTQGWKDTVLWSPFGNAGMGYKNFVCVESAAMEPITLKAGEVWVGAMALVPSPL